MQTLEHRFSRDGDSSTADLFDPIPAGITPVKRVEKYKRPVQADDCPCCELPKTSSDTTYWDGSIAALQKASLLGCIRCSLLQKCVIRFTDGVDCTQSRFRAWANFSLVELRLYDHGAHEAVERSLRLDVFVGDGANLTIFQDIKRQTLLPGHTSSTVTFKNIRSWILECDEAHKSCAVASSSHLQFPDRILELREDRVVLREGLVGPLPYACLSHCWGSRGDVSQTRQQDVANYTKGIPPDELSGNFRDAVEICRRLRIDYLWIDSLCIIQDSRQDLEQQLAKMASIYENAYLTIAATKSRSTKEGLFSTADSKYMATEVAETGLFVRQQPPKYPKDWHDVTADQWPLLTRGWVYQEMRLSRRVIHFCQHEVIWECDSRRYSESGRSHERLDDEEQFLLYSYEYVPYHLMADDPRRLWYRTVEEYSRLSLSFENDKLPALSALTQKMQLMRPDSRFLAGLWEDTLVLDLLWMVWPRSETNRPPIVRWPTWSWLAAQSQVMWQDSITAKCVLSNVEVLDVRYVTSGSDLTPVIHEAKITIRAPLLQALIRDRRHVFSRHTLELATGSPKGLTVSAWMEDYAYWLPGTHHLPIDTEVFIAPLAYTKMNRWHAGLILRKVRDTHVYDRVALAELRHTDDIELEENDILAKHRGHEQEQRLEERRDRLLDQVTSMLTNLPCQDFELI